MSESSTSICSMALSRLGAKRINDLDDATDTKPEAVYCRLFFTQVAKQLMRSYIWRFAQSRVRLSEDASWSDDDNTDFGYLHVYHLPADFLRLVLVWNGSERPQQETGYIYQLEGLRLLTDETSAYVRYVKWVSDVGAWDSLFIEVMILELAKRLVIPLSQDMDMKAGIDKDLDLMMRKVRTMDRQEQERIGRHDLLPWQDARYSDHA